MDDGRESSFPVSIAGTTVELACDSTVLASKRFGSYAEIESCGAGCGWSTFAEYGVVTKALRDYDELEVKVVVKMQSRSRRSETVRRRD